MSALRAFIGRMRAAARRRTHDRDFDDEITSHLAEATEDYVARGLSVEDARRHAIRDFGGVAQARQVHREVRTFAWLADVGLDIRHSIRRLGEEPAFAVLYIATLATGIGAASAVFTVLNGVLLRPLPYPDAGRLVSIGNTSADVDSTGFTPLSATQYFTYQDHARTFAAHGLWSRGTATAIVGGTPEEVRTLLVTHGTLQALGIPPALGRPFSREDEETGAQEVAILTHAYWQRCCGGNISAIGRSVTLDGRPRVIVGVLPASYRFLNETPDVIVPLQFERSRLQLGAFNYSAVGRLAAASTIEQAHEDVARMNRIWLDAWPPPPGFEKERFERAPRIRWLKHEVVGDTGEVLWLLMGTIAVVLLIACANAANLLLVRTEQRRAELAVRAALGAGTARIARELLLESLLLGSLSGAVALAVTFAAVRALVALAPAGLPRIGEITVDVVVFAFALGVSLVAALVTGLLPVLRYAVNEAIPLLRVADRTTSESRQQRRTRNGLVVAQVSLALVLLVGAGLMVRTFAALRAVAPGFADAGQVQLLRIAIPRTLIADPEQVFRVQREIRDRIAALPGVASASLTSAAPMEPFVSVNSVFAEDGNGTPAKIRRFKFVSPGYFATVATPLADGRDFDWTDIDRRRPVAVISENMAREIWREPHRAIGRRIRESPSAPWREVIGVVGDVFDDGVHAQAPAIAYWPAILENFEGDRIRVRRSMTVAVRTSRAGSEGLLRDMQAAVWTVNGQLPLSRVQTLDSVYERSMARTSFTLVMLAIAAAVALTLGLVGIYGLIASTVAQRTREIGIRVALGARPSQVRRMFVERGVRLAGIGVVTGMTAAIALTRLMSSVLFGVSTLDPLTFLATSLVLIAAAALASYVPARRASAVDPVEALRGQ